MTLYGGCVAGRWVLNISFRYTLLHLRVLWFGRGLDNAETGTNIAFT